MKYNKHHWVQDPNNPMIYECSICRLKLQTINGRLTEDSKETIHYDESVEDCRPYLVPSETFFLWRRRKGYDQLTTAKIYGTSIKKVREWERGYDEKNIPTFVLNPPPSLIEQCIIIRRRLNLSQFALGVQLGTSKDRISLWEQGKGDYKRLLLHFSLLQLLPL